MPEEGAISRAPGSKKPRVKASSARSNAKDDLSIEMVFRCTTVSIATNRNRPWTWDWPTHGELRDSTLWGPIPYGSSNPSLRNGPTRKLIDQSLANMMEGRVVPADTQYEWSNGRAKTYTEKEPKPDAKLRNRAIKAIQTSLKGLQPGRGQDPEDYCSIISCRTDKPDHPEMLFVLYNKSSKLIETRLAEFAERDKRLKNLTDKDATPSEATERHNCNVTENDSKSVTSPALTVASYADSFGTSQLNQSNSDQLAHRNLPGELGRRGTRYEPYPVHPPRQSAGSSSTPLVRHHSPTLNLSTGHQSPQFGQTDFRQTVNNPYSQDVHQQSLSFDLPAQTLGQQMPCGQWASQQSDMLRFTGSQPGFLPSSHADQGLLSSTMLPNAGEPVLQESQDDQTQGPQENFDWLEPYLSKGPQEDLGFGQIDPTQDYSSNYPGPWTHPQ